MTDENRLRRVNESVALGNLLANTIGSVVDAQEKIDAYTERRRLAYESAPEGSLALPPIWYVFNNVSVEMELSAAVGEISTDIHPNPMPHLVCRTLDPATVSLYGRESAAGLKIRVDLAPQGFLPIKQMAPGKETNEEETSEDKT